MLFERNSLSFAAIVVALVLCTSSSVAQAQTTKTPFDWVTAWAKVAPAQNSVKDSITRGMERCAGPSIKPADIKVFSLDLNKDGLTDYSVDMSAIAKDMKPTCDDQACVGKDCYLWTFLKRKAGRTQVKIKPPKDAAQCPANAADNTSCLSHCPATEAQCPKLFRDVYYLVWNNRAGDWAVYDSTALPAGRTLVPNPANGRVLSVTLNEKANLCNNDEIAQNGGHCVKYYQWDPSLLYLRDIWRPIVTTSGSWPQMDMYNYQRFNHGTPVNAKGDKKGDGFAFRLDAGMHFALNTQIGHEDLCPIACPEAGDEPDGEECTEVTVKETVEDCAEPFGRTPVGDETSTEDAAPGDQKCTTKTVDVTKIYCTPASTKLSVQRDGDTCYKTCSKNAEFTCLDMKNASTTNYFLPNNTVEEFSSFYYNLPKDVTVKSCERRYTSWRGNAPAAMFLNSFGKSTPLTSDVCSQITDIPCDSSVVVSLTRDCETSLGTNLDCGQCNADAAIEASERALTCSQQVTCFGAACKKPAACIPNWHVASYGTCSTSCGGGTQAVNSEDGCGNSSTTQQPCNTNACPESCVPNWVVSSISACSAPCGGGTQTLTSVDGCGNTYDTNQACNTHACPVSCVPNWQYVGATSCSATCGGGTQTHTSIDRCGNSAQVSLACNTHACCTPSWHVTGFGSCSATCGGGTQDVYSADGCGGTVTTQMACNTEACTRIETPGNDGVGGDGGGADCVDPNSQITMPGGRRRSIDTLKVGDKVTAFKIDHPETLFPAAIARVETSEMPSITINDHLTLSRNHIMLTQNRGRVTADSLQVKDVLLRADGTGETVKMIGEAKASQDLVNIFIEGADGYVADGYLVLSAPGETSGAVPGAKLKTPKAL